MRLKTEHNINKAILLSFLLLAGIVILVHAITPHHHHHGIPVITASAQHDDSHPDDPNDTEIVYLRLGDEKQIFKSLNFDFDLLHCFFSDYATCQIKNNIGLRFEQPPYIQPFHTDFIVHSTGLRAPPFQLKIRN